MLSPDYFPAKGAAWEHLAPTAAGFDAAGLKAAVDYALANETDWPKSISDYYLKELKEPPPLNEILGPMRDRGGPAGLVLRGGRIVAEWGDGDRADMTFSATKSYLSTCVGLALDRGLIADLDAPVRLLVDDGGFEPPHNANITWTHLLQQTSEWEGTLWDKPDMIDRNRQVGAASDGGEKVAKGAFRALGAPGTFWEYNDVRVNRLALAALRVLREPLPKLLKAAIMDPIGASDGWEWHGYRNSWVEIAGTRMQSVSGGAHWGGGMFISARDHARFGHLFLRRGRWRDRQLISENWVEWVLRPCAINPHYGGMWWLNSDGKAWPGVSSRSFMARGAGNNIVWVDPATDIVAVARWIKTEAIAPFVARIAASVRS